MGGNVSFCREQSRRFGVPLQGQFEVANVYGTTCDKARAEGEPSWKQAWVNKTGQPIPETCQIKDCGNRAEVGGHMFLKGHMRSTNFILPICQKCNQDCMLNCGNAQCLKYAPTERTWLLPLEQHACVTVKQDEDWHGEQQYQKCNSKKKWI
mmetsp:Transcript_72590/g.130707  ORF Transcript_72590/g.130707 Transcript_72590/m.130707 type:complete len:152 (+) Transcript_72590:206-661(+)